MLRGWSAAKPQPERENLAGVTFHNEESGFWVLRVKVRGQRDLITVVGHAATIGAGEFIRQRPSYGSADATATMRGMRSVTCAAES